MRRLLLAVMILLLPLRGLMGDAMALSMVGLPAQAGAAATAQGDMPCPDHAATPAQAPQHASVGGDLAEHVDELSASNSSEHAHTACDLCNGPAMSLSSPGHPWLPTVHGVSAGPVERFASSEPQRGIKPPIS